MKSLVISRCSDGNSGGIEKEWCRKLLVKSTSRKQKNRGTKENRQVIEVKKESGWNGGDERGGTKTIPYDKY